MASFWRASCLLLEGGADRKHQADFSSHHAFFHRRRFAWCRWGETPEGREDPQRRLKLTGCVGPPGWRRSACAGRSRVYSLRTREASAVSAEKTSSTPERDVTYTHASLPPRTCEEESSCRGGQTGTTQLHVTHTQTGSFTVNSLTHSLQEEVVASSQAHSSLSSVTVGGGGEREGQA